MKYSKLKLKCLQIYKLIYLIFLELKKFKIKSKVFGSSRKKKTRKLDFLTQHYKSIFTIHKNGVLNAK